MKIIVINGSPKGGSGKTNIIANTFLKGAKEAGAETLNIFLADMKIEHCKGCHYCWSKGPGQCVIGDDMHKVLMSMAGADIIAFASPVYFENISGMLKVFMDRMTMIGSPHAQESTTKDNALQNSNVPTAQFPKLMMISSCGHPAPSEFDVTSLWIQRVAQKMHMELVAEIYAAQSKYLIETPENIRSIVVDYLQLVAKAGKEIAVGYSLSAETKKQLYAAREGFTK